MIRCKAIWQSLNLFQQCAGKSGLLFAKSIVNPQRSVIPLRVINVSDDTKVLHYKTTIATGEETSTDCMETPSTEDHQFSKIPEHMQDLLSRSTSHLDVSQSAVVEKLLVNFQDSFARSKMDIGRTDQVQHRINTGAAPPIKQHPRRQPVSRRETINEEMRKMKELGIIEPSSSPWASPVVLVKKKDGSCHFCIDYRQLNEVTIKDSYPLPRIDDSLDALRGEPGTRWFSTMDLASGYWQVGMDPADAPKTAFTTSDGLYQFRIMLLGLCNALNL